MSDARACFEEALQGYRSIGDGQCIGLCIGNVAGLAHEMGSLTEARHNYGAAIEALRSAGRNARAAHLVAALAAVDAAEGALRPAVAAFDAAESELREIGDDLFLGAVALYRGHLDLAQARNADEKGDAEAAALFRKRAEDRYVAVAGLCEQSDEVRLAYRLLQQVLPPPARDESPSSEVPADPGALVVEAEGRWFRAPGHARVDLTRRESLRLMLAELVRKAQAGRVVTVDDLRQAGWPGQAMSRTSGAARVYTALSTLRNLGLRDVLQSVKGEHLLSPKVRLLVVGK